MSVDHAQEIRVFDRPAQDDTTRSGPIPDKFGHLSYSEYLSPIPNAQFEEEIKKNANRLIITIGK